MRGEDDIHWFRTTFKSRIIGREYRSLTIGDSEQVFEKIAKQLPLRLKKFSAYARALLPHPHNMEDVVAIVEFLLNTKWEEISSKIRDSVLSYIRSKHGRLQQIDSFLVVKRVRHQERH